MIATLTEQHIAPFLQATNKKDVLLELAALVAATCQDSQKNKKEELYKVLQERESIGSTGIGDGIAIPHGKLDSLSELTICFGRSFAGVPFDAVDGKPVHLFFVLLAPTNSAGPYLNCLAELTRFLKSPRVRTRLLHAASTREILTLFSTASEFN